MFDQQASEQTPWTESVRSHVPTSESRHPHQLCDRTVVASAKSHGT